MSTLEDRARAAKEHLASDRTDNPASRQGATLADGRKRVPMTLPQTRLSAPEIPGYHTHWMFGSADRIAQAEAAGYEFVLPAEVRGKLSARITGVGSPADGDSSDLGDRVTTLANPHGGGEVDGTGQPARLVLMKQKLEWYEEDQRLLQARNDSVVDALTASFRSGTVGGKADGETSEDMAQRYVGQSGGVRGVKIPDLFKRKTRK